MIKRCIIWCVCLIAWLIGSYAIAESRYDALCRENSLKNAHVTAWLEIPGAAFCRPVMQHDSDDGFYAGHKPNGSEAKYGSIYTQSSYNASDFSDPVTVIYGSSKAAGAPFRDLQETFSGSFEKCREIYIHLPDGTLEYRVFAAVPYSSIHILHYYNFSVQRRYESFFSSVYSTRRLGMHLDEADKPVFGDDVLILSTGIRGDNMQRYLVMAKRMNE
ncbi:MAG: class B sortase [Clostridia bacterium]|nr:class B sortase [Clostridia bacterium]